MLISSINHHPSIHINFIPIPLFKYLDLVFSTAVKKTSEQSQSPMKRGSLRPDLMTGTPSSGPSSQHVPAGKQQTVVKKPDKVARDPKTGKGKG